MSATLPVFLRKISFVAIVLFLLLQPFSTGLDVFASQEQMDTQNTQESNPAVDFTLGSALPAASQAPDYALQVAYEAAKQQQEQEVLRLKADISPAIYIPGKPVTLSWTVRGHGQVASQKDALQIILEVLKGVEIAGKAGFYRFAGIAVADINGQLDLFIAESAEFPLIFGLKLMRKNEVLDEQQVLLNKAKLDGSVNGKALAASDGKVKLNFTDRD